MDPHTDEADGEHRTINRRTYLAGVAAAGAAGFAGCADSASGATTGKLATQVTDQPGDIADFESCVVTIVGMWLGPAAEDGEDGAVDDGEADDSAGDNESDESTDDEDQADGTGSDEETEDGEGGRAYYEYDEPQEADLVQLQGEQTQLVDDRELDVGTHGFLQLDVDGVDATLENGESAQVEVPGNAPLKFNASFEIREDTRTLFTADFTPVKRGQTGRYNLQPVARGTTVEYEVVGEDEPAGDETDSGGGDNESSAGDE